MTYRDLPSIEGSQTTTLGSTELHQDGTSVNVLDCSAVDVDSHPFEALLCRLEDVGEQFLGVHILETSLKLANGRTQTRNELQDRHHKRSAKHNNHPAELLTTTSLAFFLTIVARERRAEVGIILCSGRRREDKVEGEKRRGEVPRPRLEFLGACRRT